jgi:hypothetical protein
VAYSLDVDQLCFGTMPHRGLAGYDGRGGHAAGFAVLAVGETISDQS